MGIYVMLSSVGTPRYLSLCHVERSEAESKHLIKGCIYVPE